MMCALLLDAQRQLLDVNGVTEGFDLTQRILSQCGSAGQRGKQASFVACGVDGRVTEDAFDFDCDLHVILRRVLSYKVVGFLTA